MMKQTKKMNRGEPRYNEQNEGIMVCDSVSAYVCVLPLCLCVCASVLSQVSTRAYTHALVIVITSLFLSFFMTFSTFNIDLIGPSRPMSTCACFCFFCIQIMENI